MNNLKFMVIFYESCLNNLWGNLSIIFNWQWSRHGAPRAEEGLEPRWRKWSDHMEYIPSLYQHGPTKCCLFQILVLTHISQQMTVFDATLVCTACVRHHHCARTIMTLCSGLLASSVDIHLMLLSRHNQFIVYLQNALLKCVNATGYEASVATHFLHFGL